MNGQVGQLGKSAHAPEISTVAIDTRMCEPAK